MNQTEIRLYLSFSDWFVTKRTSVWFQINLKMVNTIWFQVNLTRYRKYFSVCTRKERLKMIHHEFLCAKNDAFLWLVVEIIVNWRISPLLDVNKNEDAELSLLKCFHLLGLQLLHLPHVGFGAEFLIWNLQNANASRHHGVPTKAPPQKPF